MKIGVLMVVNCDQENVEYSLKGVYDFCDVIVVVHSDTNWAGVKKSDNTLAKLRAFEDPAQKLRVTTGSFPIQKEHRTFALEAVRKEKCDYVFIVDGDEIYDPKSLVNTRAFMQAHPEAHLFHVKFCQMWKTLSYKLIPDRNIGVIWKLTKDLHFIGNARRIRYKKDDYIRQVDPEATCYHLTCTCTDAFMKEKITTRGYKNKVVKGWYEEKWLKWYPDMENLHPTRPDIYKKAVLIDKATLPPFVTTHVFYK